MLPSISYSKFSNNRVDYLEHDTQKFVFCQKPLKMFCVQKDTLEDVTPLAKEIIENKTVKNMYNSATDCIQYCKSNNEKVSHLKCNMLETEENHLVIHVACIRQKMRCD